MSSIRKQFIITINSFRDINFDHSDVEFLKQLKCNGIILDSDVFDDLCENTIDYCYQALRESGEVISSGTRDNLTSLIGDYLFRILLKNRVGDKLLKNKVGNELIKSINHNDKINNENEKEDLQLILKFGDSPDALKLAKCPWEYLHYSNDEDYNKSYYLLAKIKLHRVYDKPSSGIDTLKKMKVLVFFSPRKGQFDDQHITQLRNLFNDLNNEYGDKENERDNKNIFKGNFAFNFIYPEPDSSDPKATYDTFLTTINQFKPDVIHYIGEAQYKNDKEEKLFFWDQSGLDVEAQGKNLLDDFYSGLKRSISNAGLKLVIFQTWNNYDNEAYLAFKKIAIKLIENNLPAVLSIPYSFHLTRTNSFNIYKSKIFEFYKSLIGEGKSLSDAIFSLRTSLKIAGKGYPIVYLGSSDTDNFKVQQKTKTERGEISINKLQIKEGLGHPIQEKQIPITEPPYYEKPNPFAQSKAYGGDHESRSEETEIISIFEGAIDKNINNYKDNEEKLSKIESTNDLNKVIKKLEDLEKTIIIPNLQNILKNDINKEKFFENKNKVIKMITDLWVHTEKQRQKFLQEEVDDSGSEKMRVLMDNRLGALNKFKDSINNIG